MSVIATDAFTRADENPLSGGGVWTTQTSESAWTVSGNTAIPSNMSVNCGANYTGASWPADQYAQATLTATTAAGSGGPGVYLRADTAAATYYRAIFDVAGAQIEIAKKITGTKTQLGLRAVTWVSNDLLYFEVQGSTLMCKQNGVALGATISDSAIATGNAGLAYASTSNTGIADLWEGGSVTTAIVHDVSQFPKTIMRPVAAYAENV